MTRVLASIVSTGEATRVRACLRSLTAQRFDGQITVAVVVNGTDDGTVAATREMFPTATLIRRSTPMGFAENHDDALASSEFDFGVVLNPDVMLETDCVATLVAAMERHPRAGVIAPLLVYPDGSPQPSARRFPRIAGTLARRTPLRALFGEKIARSEHYLPPPTEDREVDWALGACLFVRNAAWNEVGGFDRGFRPLYVEDIDLGWRMWEAGWSVWQTPCARAVHEHQAATDKVFFDSRTMWHARGMARFVTKHPRILVGGSPRNAGP
ncbi:MAG: glycosyltransferase family 2 protein [Gemmatimonadota bacterium]|nr:glycosyltransferase family 2 protein [Gemmatimonadota bacterium]